MERGYPLPWPHDISRLGAIRKYILEVVWITDATILILVFTRKVLHTTPSGTFLAKPMAARSHQGPMSGKYLGYHLDE